MNEIEHGIRGTFGKVSRRLDIDDSNFGANYPVLEVP